VVARRVRRLEKRRWEMAEKADDGWIQTYTGRRFWPLSPSVEDISLLDISHALSLKCRFVGHVSRFYSVAAHSVSVSRAIAELDPKCSYMDRLWGLLHDAGEAYLPDVPSPIRNAFPELKRAEEQIMLCVATAFGLPWPAPEIVKRADLAVLARERQYLMDPIPGGWPSMEGVVPAGELIDCGTAKETFLREASYLVEMASFGQSTAEADDAEI
jgi:hypothetical protein